MLNKRKLHATASIFISMVLIFSVMVLSSCDMLPMSEDEFIQETVKTGQMACFEGIFELENNEVLNSGIVPLNNPSETAIIVRNVGEGPLTIYAIMYGVLYVDWFLLDGDSTFPEDKTFVIQPGKSKTFRILFMPNEEGPSNEHSIVIYSDDPKHSELELLLVGEGVPN